MRILYMTAMAALTTGAPAFAGIPVAVAWAPSAPIFRVADTTADENGRAPKPDSAPANSESGGKLEIQPGPQPQQPPQPPNLNIPAPPVTPPQPGQPGTEGNPAPGQTLEQHQEPGPRGEDAEKPPRGEGAAMIPKETPSGIKAIEDWLWSWFE